jgi:hypothetical protein
LNTIRLFLLFEAIAFALASFVHTGLLFASYDDPAARLAEGIISFVLFAGLALTWIRPTWTRIVGLWVQGFALLGTMIGITAIILVPGPRKLPDLLFHAGIVAVLLRGYWVTQRTRLDEAPMDTVAHDF